MGIESTEQTEKPYSTEIRYSEQDVAKLLQYMGYEGMEVARVLDRLSERFAHANPHADEREQVERARRNIEVRGHPNPFREKITHGRHCTCSSCAREDWTNPDLAPCGMHGEGCPARYQPWGQACSFVPEREQVEEAARNLVEALDHWSLEGGGPEPRSMKINSATGRHRTRVALRELRDLLDVPVQLEEKQT